MRIRILALLPVCLAFALTTATCAHASSSERIRIMVGGVEKQISLPAMAVRRLPPPSSLSPRRTTQSTTHGMSLASPEREVRPWFLTRYLSQLIAH